MSDINSNLIDISSQTTSWIYQEVSAGRMKVDESFQRRYVWTTKDKIKLIETMLLGFTIPEIYLWDIGIDSNTGLIHRSIVDGQQRIHAIVQYINNEYKLEESGLEIKNEDFVNKYFKDLDENLKRKIFIYKFSVRMINSEVTKNQIVQIFDRLNCTSYDLTPQELRNAKFNGKFLILATTLADIPFWSKYGFFPGVQKRRMKDVEFISNILIYYRQGIEEEITQTKLNQIYKLYDKNYPDMQSDKIDFLNMIDKIESLIQSGNNNTLAFIKKLTHLYTLCIVISYLLKKNLYNAKTAEKLLEFINIYQTNLYDSNENEKIMSEYKELSLEKTTSKQNRIGRFNLLIKYLNI